MADNRFYMVWKHMIQRCTDPSISNYYRYGGRGIKVCNRWQKYENFVLDMFPSYVRGLTLERINNDGNYEPENCRWATRKEQANNTRNIEKAKKYTFNGITQTTRQWAEELGIKRTTLDMRLRHYKWPVEKAFERRVGL